jgi:uncharacterized membrane protein (UPF0182 family)
MFEVSKAINDFADRLVSVPGIGRIVKNPIYTALLIVVVIMLITMYIFRNAETDDPLFTMVLRGGVYIFIFLTGVIFLHNHVLMSEFESVRGANEGIFTETVIDPLENDRVSVAVPNAFM